MIYIVYCMHIIYFYISVVIVIRMSHKQPNFEALQPLTSMFLPKFPITVQYTVLMYIAWDSSKEKYAFISIKHCIQKQENKALQSENTALQIIRVNNFKPLKSLDNVICFFYTQNCKIILHRLSLGGTDILNLRLLRQGNYAIIAVIAMLCTCMFTSRIILHQVYSNVIFSIIICNTTL